MIRALVDTNVILDFLLHRPDFPIARKLMLFAMMGDYELWMSSSQVTDIHYVASNRGTKSQSIQAQEAIIRLRKCVRIVSLGEREIDMALECRWDDFEDSVMHQAAVNIGASAIITRNVEDYLRSSVPAMTPESFFAWLERRHGLMLEEIPF